MVFRVLGCPCYILPTYSVMLWLWGLLAGGWACTKGQQFSIFRAEALYVVVFSVVWVGDTIGF